MTESTFDASKNYKKVCYRADRDLLNTELNEAQDIESHERRMLLGKILAQGTIISGLTGTVDGGSVTIQDGIVYLDGCAVNVPGAALTFPDTGEYLIYVDVFRRVVTASEDTALVNPLTGEPTAEREKWIATLQTRDTMSDPLPDGALSRTVAPVYIFNRDTGELRPYVGSTVQGGDIFSAFSNHAGHGGLDRHPAATADLAGFMTPEQVASLTSFPVVLDAHKASGEHDGRYYTESESDGRFASLSHVGAGGSAHPVATTSQAGFMSASDKTELSGHESRLDSIEGALPGKADDADVNVLTNALAAHKTSADHDDRYFTEMEADNRFAPKNHVGSAGVSQHPTATTSAAGFMSSSDKTLLGNHETRIAAVETAFPGKADDADVTAVSSVLTAHKSSSDHDSRYFTETESDARFAPIAHVGAAGSAHALATAAQAGFLAKEVSGFLSGLIRWTGAYDYGGDGTGSLAYDIISGATGMIWRGRCDSGSSHHISAMLRATGSSISAVFEIYHITGTVSMETSTRVQLADAASHPSTVPGSKVYYVQLYPDSFTYFSILVSGEGDVGFSLSIFPGDDRQVCYELDPGRSGKSIS